MYVYMLAEGMHPEDHYEELIGHEQCFTQKQFEQMCLNALKTVESETGYPCSISEITEKLIENHGFKPYRHNYQAYFFNYV